jgi:transcription initiation factor IIE alpha subunit
MRFNVDCPHCEAVLSVPEQIHYQTITCPDCGGQVEAVSTETVRVTRQFIEQLEDGDDQVGVTSLPHPPPAPRDGGGGESAS